MTTYRSINLAEKYLKNKCVWENIDIGILYIGFHHRTGNNGEKSSSIGEEIRDLDSDLGSNSISIPYDF